MIEKIKSNLQAVRGRMDDAAKKSGRSANEVKLIGVTKYVDAETTRLLLESGCSDLGESRPQVLWEKSEVLVGSSPRWHLIGHLQRNKAKRTVPICELIHSVDSHRLLSTINQAGQDTERTVHVLLEVNVSGESAKHGFAPDDLPAALEFISGLTNVVVDGLMCMAGLSGGIEAANREFEMLRIARQTLQSNQPDNVDLKELSMGMSGDFETAIEQGSTMVRVGSLLFEGI